MSAQLQAGLAPAGGGQWRSLRRAAWLSDDVLLLASANGREGGDQVEPSQVEASAFAGPGEDIAATRMHEPLPAEIEESLTGLKAFVREGPAAWDAERRTELLGFFASLGGELGLTPSLAEGLRQVRDALRERRPVSLSDRSVERGVAVERLHRIDPGSFYVRGRAWDKTAPVTALTAVSPEGERVELHDSLTPHPGGEGGFAGLFETANPTHGDDGWVFEATSGFGPGVEASVALSPDPLRTIFADAALRFAAAEELRERHILPAAARINEARRRSAELVELGRYGDAPRAPAVSLIVPLQRRIDLVEHQVAQLADDPDLAGCELLYVLDEPDQSEALRELGAELFGLYGLPLRLAAATAPVGLPIACALAAPLARGERLVFLGSDVLPDGPGWLRVMSGPLDADPAVAAVTPKLLYADGAIDQAGLEYVHAAAGWDASHRLAGMHRDVTAAAAGGPVAAASLACLMIDAAAFERAGGLKGEYSLSDYEGSDLSLRLAEMGLRVHYAPEAELFRLEGLGAEPEALGEAHARWLHSRLWADAIAGAAR